MNIQNFSNLISGLSDTHRPIRLRIASANQTLDHALIVQHLHGQESMNSEGDCLTYTLHCVSTQANLALKDFLACPIEIQFVTERGDLHSVCGLIQDIRAGQPDGGLATYQLVVRDALSLMQGRTNTRVFLNSDELQITEVLLREWRQHNPALARCFDIDWSALSGTYPARAFTMQANETDTQFLTRLWKRRGINWFIRAGPSSQRSPYQSSDPAPSATPQHTLVLFNTVHLLPKPPDTPWPYRPSNGTQSQDRIYAWQAARTLVPGNLTRHSWDYQNPGLSSITRPGTSNQGTLGNQFAANLHDSQLDSPHTGDDRDDYLQLTERRIEYHEYRAKSFQADSDLRHVQLGDSFILGGHPEIDSHPPEQRQFVITELEVDAHNNLPTDLSNQIDRLFAANGWHTGFSQSSATNNGSGSNNHSSSGNVSSNDDSSSDTRYRNRFTCVRRGIPIVPAYDPRTDLPTIHPMTALVVTDPGEEITCNALGCARVTIPGCTIEDHAHAKGAGASGTATDSAWIRVASNWASTGYGTSALCRKGDEVLLQFLNGNCDKPIITNRVHNGSAPPVAFSHTGSLPGNKALSGIKSKELGGQRYNQLRLDDTPKQISAQLASQHAYSELNLGYLTHPRTDGQAPARGEGAELRSDQKVAVRGGAGVLISATPQSRANGAQLERAELLGLIGLLQGVQQQLADLATTHHVDDVNSKPLAQLVDYLKQWDAGSNQENGQTGQSIVAVTAPAGIALTSQDNVAIGAQTTIDLLSVGNTQLASGQQLLLHAVEAINLFAHRLGMKLVAASGKLELQTHQDDIELISARRIMISAAEEVMIQAPKVTIITQGSQINYGNAITYQTSGPYTIKSAGFTAVGPGASNLAALNLPKSVVKTDEQFKVAEMDGAAASGLDYQLKSAGQTILSGTSNADGASSLHQAETIDNLALHLQPKPTPPEAE